jgi:hypothetical protein
MANSLHPEGTAFQRYWVVGGKYETLDFDRLIQGTERVFGPFEFVEDAQSTWRSVTEQTRYQATVRYTIATDPIRLSQITVAP